METTATAAASSAPNPDMVPVLRGGTTVLVPNDQALMPGDRVVTGDKPVDVLVRNAAGTKQAVVRVSPNSEVLIRDNSAVAAGEDVADIEVIAGDAVFVASASESVQVRLGALEDVERSESEQISLRVFVGGASASIASTDLGDAALDELASRAVAMARLAPADKYAGLAPEELLLRGAPPARRAISPSATTPTPAPARSRRRSCVPAWRTSSGFPMSSR